VFGIFFSLSGVSDDAGQRMGRDGQVSDITAGAAKGAPGTPRAAGGRTDLLQTTRPLAVARHLGLPVANGAPSEHPGWEHIGWPGEPQLLWPARERLTGPASWVCLSGGEGPITLCARVLELPAARAALAELPGRFSPELWMTDFDSHPVAAVWRDEFGNVALPFDPDEVAETLWSEAYATRMGGHRRGAVGRGALGAYYLVRRALPRRMQIWLRRRYARVQARTMFPRWPLEPSLHAFLDQFTALLAGVCGEPVPYLAPWPDGHDWALVLTHDVETAGGLARIEPLAAVERELGLRSAWYFVPRRYDVDDALVARLRADGFEVGVHGLYHDGRDLSSLSALRRRLPAMAAAGRRWGAIGFRSPATRRNWDWMPLLPFDYDSSSPDTDPFEPESGGCCSWWPLMNRQLVELPITMPQDHTLFVILGHRDESVWVEKADALRGRGGMALLLTHPDYLDQVGLDPYRRLLERYADDPTAWRALPSEVSAWWRRRAASRIVPDGDGWAVEGPAAGEAVIAFAGQR
jgi:hypothetical protein